MNLILDIDTQVDFMFPYGALSVPKAESIIENIKKLMVKLYVPIISTIDEHDVNDEEFKTFPRHCVTGTHGMWKIPETLVYQPDYAIKGDKDFTEEDLENNKQFILPKRTYNIWDEKLGNLDNLNRLLEFFLPDTVHVVGVATDICVLSAVKGLSDKVNHIVLHTDCMKGLTTESEEKALVEMLALGNVWDEK